MGVCEHKKEKKERKSSGFFFIIGGRPTGHIRRNIPSTSTLRSSSQKTLENVEFSVCPAPFADWYDVIWFTPKQKNKRRRFEFVHLYERKVFKYVCVGGRRLVGYRETLAWAWDISLHVYSNIKLGTICQTRVYNTWFEVWFHVRALS